MFLVEVVVARLCTKIIVFGMLCFTGQIRMDQVVIEGSLNGGVRWLDGISSEIYKEKELQFVGVTGKTG